MIECKGVINGKTIELTEDLGLAPGVAVTVIVQPTMDPREALERSAGSWAGGDDEEFKRWEEEMRRSRDIDRPELPT
jgi:hypothetical protein